MKIKLIVLGKTTQPFVTEGLQLYEKRISKYYRFEAEYLNNTKIKSTKAKEVKLQEAKLLLPYFKAGSIHILLDEKGKAIDSVKFAGQLEKWMNTAPQTLAFYVGGAFGFDTSVYEKATYQLSLSTMTFSHQLIRLIFMEQLYRAVSIIHRLPYHNV